MRVGAIDVACLGAALLSLVGCGEGTTNAVSSCATLATADLSVAAPFDVDTGLGAGAVQANYGQPSCPSQYLVDIDLTAAAFQGPMELMVSGIWSSVLPSQPCDEKSSMAVFVLGTHGQWQTFDQVTYVGQFSQGYCEPIATHSDVSLAGYGVTAIPLTNGYTRARMAVNATEGSTYLPIAVFGEIS
jgi:hypothetical protein